MRGRAVWTIFCFCFTLLPAYASPEVEIHVPRQFGYFVGDLIEVYVDVRMPATAQLQQASLPAPGPLNAWLDLRNLVMSRSTEPGSTLWHLHLTYQNFYLALDVREMEIPALPLVFLDGGDETRVEVPSWRIRVAPLREVLPEKQENGVDYLRPDASNVSIVEHSTIRTALLTGLTLLLGFFCLWDRAFWPFQKRRARAFTAGAREISSLATRTCGPEFYHSAFLTLHRSIEKAAGHTILFEDLPAYLAQNPQYAPLADSFKKFFTASRQAFFRETEQDLNHLFAKPDLVAFASRLAVLERTAP